MKEYNFIDISTEEKKKEVLKLFDTFNKIGDIYDYYGYSDNPKVIKYVKEIAEKIGFDLNSYKERRHPKRYCLICGKELKRGQKKTCSKSCSVTYTNKQRPPMKEETKDKIRHTLSLYYTGHSDINDINDINDSNEVCQQCGRELINKQKKFCSAKCAAAYRKYKRQKTEIICQNCGKTFNGLTGRKFCSVMCSNENLKKERLQKFLNSEYILDGNNGLPKFIREYLLDKAQYKCELCGFEGYNQKTGKTILQIHHKDGNSSNNTPENLLVICPNCHAMTENYMALNKGNSSRDKRYKK
jgi:predicted nucleic acid-binding Zn ribbon protein